MRTMTKLLCGSVGLLTVLIAPAIGFGAYTMTARWEGSRVENYGGAPRTVMYVVAMGGRYVTPGQEMKVGLYNQDDAKGPYPDPEIASAIKTLSQGDYLNIDWKKDDAHDNITMAIKVAPYQITPGEEQPNGYIFQSVEVRSENQHDYTFLHVKKLGSDMELTVMEKPGVKGAESTADPDLLASVQKLQKGDVFLAETLPAKPNPVVTSVELYTAPRTGIIKALKSGKYNDNRTPMAEIDVDGSPVEVYVPGHLDGKRWVVDSKIQKMLSKFHRGSKVLFRTTDDNGTALLRDIQPAPKDAPKTSSKPHMASGESEKTMSPGASSSK